MFTVTKIHAREVLDSRGNPTVEVDITLEGSHFGRAIAPSGASVGTHEAVELRDGDPKRFHGKGVLKAVENVNAVIARNVVGRHYSGQKEFDTSLIELDGSLNKAVLGANATVATSLAFAKALASYRNMPLYAAIAEQFFYKPGGPSLPIPMLNVINGGCHADNSIDLQEFMLLPTLQGKGGDRSEKYNIADALRVSSEIFHVLAADLKQHGMVTALGDEGGFAPSLRSNEEALDWLCRAIDKAGCTGLVQIAIDAAASTFYERSSGMYHLAGEGLSLNSVDMVAYYERLLRSYPIVSLEDPVAEDDIDSWQLITKELGKKVKLVGDDIFVTNSAALARGIELQIANAILIKPNQIGTLSETMAAIELATRSGYDVVISHRSGDTEDTTISHLAVAAGNYIKAGSVSRSERACKYNELLRIAEGPLNGAV